MRLVLLFFFCGVVFAQPTLNPSSTIRYKRTGPFWAPNQFVAVTAPQTGCIISVAFSSGALINGDDLQATVTDNTTPGVVRFRNNFNVNRRTPGDYSAVYNISLSGSGCSGTAAFTYTLRVVPGNAYFPIYHANTWQASSGNCFKSNAIYMDNDTCNYPSDNSNTQTGTPLVPAALGGQVTGEHGEWIRTISNSTWTGGSGWTRIHPYSSVGPFSYNDQFAWFFNTSAPNGQMEYVNVTTGAQTWTNMPSTNDVTMIDTRDLSWWDLTPVSSQGYVTHYVPTSAPSSYTATQFNFSTLGFGTVRFWTGASARMTRDGWFAWFALNEGGGVRKACVLNTNGLTVANRMSKVYCTDYTATGLTNVNLNFVTEIDRVTKDRYVLLLGGNQTNIYRVNMTTQTLDLLAIPEGESSGSLSGAQGANNDFDTTCEPASGEFCPVAAHYDVTQWDGEQMLCSYRDGGGSGLGTTTFLGCFYINRLHRMMEPVEVGGGLAMVFPVAPFEVSYEIGCSWSGLCTASGYPGGGYHSAVVTGATAAAPTVITIGDTWRGWATGQRVSLWGAVPTGTGWANCLQGNWVITMISSNQVQLNGSNCTGGSGAYNGNSARIGRNDWLSERAPYQSENLSWDMYGFVRSGYTRAYPHGSDSGPGTYYQLPMTGVSHDGTMLLFHSNFGRPYDNRTYVANSLWATNRMLKVTILPTPTGGILTTRLPEAQTCSIISSTRRDFVSPFQSSTTGSSTYVRHVITGVAANTAFWTRVNCGSAKYNWYGSSVSAASVSGSATIHAAARGVTGASDIVLDWGTTSSLGNTSTAVACASGTECRATASATRGLIYTRTRIRDGSGGSLSVSPITATHN